MIDDEPCVATAQWRCEATFVAVAETTSLVDAFAGGHGMQTGAREGMTLALAEVLAHVADAQPGSSSARGAAVDAAIDAAWLTVRVHGMASTDDGGIARATAISLADRVEWDATAADGLTVLMEFATGPAPAAALNAPRQRPATARRSPRGETRTARSRDRRPRCRCR